MAKKIQKKKPAAKPAAVPRPKDFLDMVAPSAVKFNTDCSIIGGAYHTFLSPSLLHNWSCRRKGEGGGSGGGGQSKKKRRSSSTDVCECEG